MIRSPPLVWRLGVASLSLLAAVAVYLFARIYPPEILMLSQNPNGNLATHAEIFGSAPSFFYTLALGLFIGASAQTTRNARLHCLVWIGLALGLEISQHPSITEPLSTWFSSFLSEFIWDLVGPYWIRGVFDPLDLLATLAGGIIAFVLLGKLPMKCTNENYS